MTAQDLKNSILQLAVEGKLLKGGSLPLATAGKPSSATPSAGTPRNAPSDPKTGAELLEQIKAEKARLIAEGKIKKDTTKAGASGRALEPITEDEKPFDIPESWCWCRLGEIGTFVRGSGIKRTETVEKGLPCVRYGEFYTTYKTKFSTIKSFIPKNIFDNCHHIIKNDICMALTGENKFDIALASVYEGDTPVAMGGDMTKFTSYFCYPLYLVYAINSPYGIKCKRNLATGDIICHISNDKLASIRIPLPPLAEQKRIVAKIEELLPYIQKYDVAHTKLEEFNKKFPVDMQKSILQQAIMGKLTEDWRNEQASLAKTNSAVQLADRSSAKDLLKKIKAQKARLIAEGKIKKDKPLAEITEDEIPFDIPESWCWCRLGDICFDIKRGKSPKYVEKSNYLAFAQKCNVKTGGINLEIALYLDESTISRYSNTDCLVQGDVVINSTGGGTMGRVGYFECEIPKGIKGIYPDSHVTTIRTVGFMEQKFVFYFLKTKQKELESLGEGSTNQTELKPYTLQNLLLPLPPLAEQKRIVAKIEELLPLCKKLVK